ncbi:hypothetical protein DUNSADRAFT_5373 [Dunaliella salina]|uniref:Uncharacterized protein n=1 Tax=Dunaliella salina TaxID=3046 RepID=A0ABQ7GQF7_DUNSA|nr:hypothetical protein DUNSADRAFT_5373 [Dunaliella salina]|eukprot:KAF5836833.1 hypothetical protein DUNSADRAFT_5373 [Dunaliella salina]
MYIDGRLGGSSNAPEAELNARLAQGAVGDTRLAKASAQFSLDAQQRAHCLLELSPADMAGHVRMAGDVQLTPPPSSAVHRGAPVSAAPANPPKDAHSSSNNISGASDRREAPALQAAGKNNNGAKKAGDGSAVGTETENADLRAQGPPSAAGQVEHQGEQGSLDGSASELVHRDGMEHEHGHAGHPGELEFSLADVTTAEGAGQEQRSEGRPLPLAPPELAGASLQLQDGGQQPRGASAAKKGAAAATGQALLEQEQEEVDVSLVVTDGGMALISALVPGCAWQSGSAAIDLRVHGSLKEPGVEGAARLSRGLLKTPFLRSPVQGVAASLRFDGRSLVIDNAEARVGRHGSMRAQGRLPLHPSHDLMDGSSNNSRSREGSTKVGHASKADAAPAEGSDSVVVDLANLDLRVSNLYTGMLDASLSLGQSLSAPHLGGWLRFSKGTLFLLPQSSSSPASDASASSPTASPGLDNALKVSPSASATSSALTGLDMAASSPLAQPTSSDADMVTTAFSMLKAGRKRSLLLHHLGTHAAPAVAEGRGSTWQEGLTLSASGTPLVSGKASAGPVGSGAGGSATGPGGNSGGARGKSGERLLVLSGLMEPPEVARVFEERLAEALLGENGQLALRSLASSTFSNLLPKIETHGQLGAARWRLVGAPSLPNLLGALDSLAASSSTATSSGSSSSSGMDPARFLSSLAVGTELDLVLGNSLTASLAHKPLGDSKIGTEATFTYSLSDFLRLQLQLQGLTRPTLLLGYNSAKN